MAGTVADVIRVAEGELGRTDGRKYFAHFGVGDLGPWCVAGARWAYDVAGVRQPWDRFYAFDQHDVPKGHSVPVREGRRGDFLSLDWDLDSWGDHVAIVLGREDWGYNTREFNTGSPGRVADCQRLFANCAAIIRPEFAEAGASGPLDVDGLIGPLTVHEWQEQVGTPADGVLSGQVPGMARWRSSVQPEALDYDDGLDGSTLVWALMRRLSSRGIQVGPKDGRWGWWFSGAVQQQLREWGYYTGGIDHDFAEHSAKALQRSLNDGKWKEFA